MVTSPITNTNSLILLNTARKLGINAQVLDAAMDKIELTQGKKSHIVHSHGFNLNSHAAIALTRDKSQTLSLLSAHHLPTLPQEVISASATPHLPFPLVLKPVSGQKGQDVYLNITTQLELNNALKRLRAVHTPILAQPFLAGYHDLRFFVLANKAIGIVHRQPPQITGDGHSTIKELIDTENLRRHALTKTSGRRMLNRLRHWPRIRWYLNQQGYHLTTILPARKTITLYPLANFSTGGSAHALTKNQIHPSLIKLAQKAVKLTGLTVAGIDMLVKDWHQPASGKNAYIIEINSDPSLRLHEWPNTGTPQPITKKLLQHIFSA